MARQPECRPEGIIVDLATVLQPWSSYDGKCGNEKLIIASLL